MAYAYVIVRQLYKPHRAFEHYRLGDLVANPVPGFDHLCLNGSMVNRQHYLPLYFIIGDKYRPQEIQRVRRQSWLEKIASLMLGKQVYWFKPKLEMAPNPLYHPGHFYLPAVEVNKITGPDAIKHIADLP